MASETSPVVCLNPGTIILNNHGGSVPTDHPGDLSNIAELEQQSKHAFQQPDSNAFGHAFREYDTVSERRSGVESFYKTNHENQTLEFSQKMRRRHLSLNKAKMTIWECCQLLNEYVDESDPDLDEPQIEHLLQTAEAIRKDFPNEDWFHLTGLIHDLGKVLLHPKFGEEPQWAVVGDTFPVGCPFSKSIVYPEHFVNNPDFNDPRYNAGYGIYEPGCGLDKIIMSWGHDEYLYQVLKANPCCKLPPQALFICRFHSFYALHRDGEYKQFMNKEDEELFPWLLEFNKYDLYSKSKERVDVEAVTPYYLSLIEKYFSNSPLNW